MLPVNDREDDKLEIGDPQLNDSGELVLPTSKSGILAVTQVGHWKAHGTRRFTEDGIGALPPSQIPGGVVPRSVGCD